jgi:type IV secretory pathway VirB6-like protein
MMRWRHNMMHALRLMMLLGLLSVLAAPQVSFALFDEPLGTETEGDPTTRDKDGNFMSCSEVPEASGVYLGKIVPCMLFTVQESTITFAELMVKWLQPLYYAFLTLVFIFYGVRVAQNEPEIYKHGLVLLLKIAIVSLVLADLSNVRSYTGTAGDGEIIPTAYDIMRDSQEIITSKIDMGTIKCDVSNYEDVGTPKLWAVFDCIAGKMFGFSKGDYNSGKMMLVTSLFGLLAGFFFGGPWGVVMFFGMVGVIVSIFMMMLRTTLAFINSYLVLCILLILAPLFLPLTMMRVTGSYYENYIKNILACFLTPILFTAFAVFALKLYDKALFADDSLLNKLFEYAAIEKALEPGKKACDWQVTVDPGNTRLGAAEPPEADMKKLFTNPFLQNLIMPTLSGANDPCALAKLPVFNFDQVGDPRYTKGKETFKAMFKDLLVIFIIAYLVNLALKALPQIITMLTSRQTSGASLKGGSDFEARFEAATSAARASAIRAFGTEVGGGAVRGGQAVQRMAPATSEGLKSFYSVMKGK